MTFIHNYLCYGNKELPNAKQMTWGFASEFFPVNSPYVMLKGPQDGSLYKFSVLSKRWCYCAMFYCLQAVNPVLLLKWALQPTELYWYHLSWPWFTPESCLQNFTRARKKCGRQPLLTSTYQGKQRPGCINTYTCI